MTKTPINPLQAQTQKDPKGSGSNAPKRSLTPRRRAREYALQDRKSTTSELQSH